MAAGIAHVEAEHGRLDVLVNAAGIELELTIEETSLDQWNRIMAINVTGTFLTCKHAMPLLKRSDHASIVNFGSYDGYVADPNLAAYCATKGAVHALTRAMACDHGKDGVRVNAICPGYIDTPMLEQFVPDGVDEATARAEQIAVHPLRTIGTPTDMANLVMHDDGKRIGAGGVAYVTQPVDHRRCYIQPACFKHQRGNGKTGQKIMCGFLRGLPQPVMCRQITIGSIKAGQTVAQHQEIARLIIGHAQPGIIESTRQRCISLAAGHIKRQINGMQFDMGNGMQQRDTPTG